jgi:hypothetical protein
MQINQGEKIDFKMDLKDTNPLEENFDTFECWNSPDRSENLRLNKTIFSFKKERPKKLLF